MNKPKLALDCDGVIYPWHIALYNELFIYNKVTCDYYTFWKSEYKKYSPLWWDNMTRVDFLYSTQIPSKETLETLEQLDKCYEIFYVTSRPIEMRLVTEQYLFKYDFPNRNNLHFTDRKGLFCLANNIEQAVEDQPKHILNLIDCCINVIAIRQPWNEDQVYQLGCPVVDSFEQVKGILL
jgi:uncharacterized HAD superfamily protein